MREIADDTLRRFEADDVGVTVAGLMAALMHLVMENSDDPRDDAERLGRVFLRSVEADLRDATRMVTQ